MWKYILLIGIVCGSCDKEEKIKDINPFVESASLGRVGNPMDVATSPLGGIVLMGGGPDVDDAFKWFIEQVDGGDIVVIRATGTDAYNEYIYSLGTVNSVETLLINSRALANDDEINGVLQKAEGIFIAGGNQADYVEYWRETKLETTLNDLMHTKKCAIGGTSAGNAILGEFYFSALKGTITSSEALQNPYHARLQLGGVDFLTTPNLEQTITDTHFNNPDRRGRLITFMARMMNDYNLNVAYGIGVEESTAVCISNVGVATVKGTGDVYFLKAQSKPDRCESGSPLHWDNEIQAFIIQGGSASIFELNEWGTNLTVSEYYRVLEGSLVIE